MSESKQPGLHIALQVIKHNKFVLNIQLKHQKQHKFERIYNKLQEATRQHKRTRPGGGFSTPAVGNWPGSG